MKECGKSSPIGLLIGGVKLQRKETMKSLRKSISQNTMLQNEYVIVTTVYFHKEPHLFGQHSTECLMSGYLVEAVFEADRDRCPS
jgi:hypothetical protein